MRKIVVGICGLTEFDRDMAAQILVNERRFHRVEFADLSKQIAGYNFSWNEKKDKQDQERPQILETEASRVSDETLWMRRWEERLDALCSVRVVAPDVRFGNEAAQILYAGDGLLLYLAGGEDFNWLDGLMHQSIYQTEDPIRLRQRVLCLVDTWFQQRGFLPKLYLSGPMLDLPNYNLPVFNATAEKLAAKGYEVVNPAEIEPKKAEVWPREYFMRRGIQLLFSCDGIAYLDGWEESKEARLEIEIARQVGLDIRSIYGWLGA